MKKLILTVVFAAFAVAVQAGDDKACADKEGAGCCSKSKAVMTTKAECPMSKEQTKACCPAMAKKDAKATAAKPKLSSPKGFETASK